MAHSGMLRASCESLKIDIDMRVVVDASSTCAVTHYRELIAFTDALLSQDRLALEQTREQLRKVVGDAGVARAAAVAGNFQLMNRALDTVGATFGDKLPSRVAKMAEQFGISPPSHWTRP